MILLTMSTFTFLNQKEIAQSVVRLTQKPEVPGLIPDPATYFVFLPLIQREQSSVDGWMTCDFTSFLTVFQSYQDDVWMIMKGCVQWNSVYG